MHYVSGVNNAGFLPEMEPNKWDTFDEAKRDLIALILEDADHYGELGDEQRAETLTSYAEKVNLWSHGSHGSNSCSALLIYGREYWIHPMDQNNILA